MTENDFKNYKLRVKNEPEALLEYETADSSHFDISTNSKELVLSPLNYDYDSVDIESINIDDIFDGNRLNDNWCLVKDEFEGSSNLVNLPEAYNPGDVNRLSVCNSNQELNPLSICNKLNPIQEDNKLFLITDILNKDKIYFNSQFHSTNHSLNNSKNILSEHQFQQIKPQLSFLLNPQFNCFDNTIIDKNDQLLCLSNSNVSPTINFLPLSTINSTPIISKTKAILPIIGPSPKKKSLPLKTGKFASQLCCICNDNATGKHYGVISCEGCKGFFKRTVRNHLSYMCRDFNNCAVDKKMRNRCQACRFQKCLSAGMKREAVQIERPDKRSQKPVLDNIETIISSPSSVLTDESLEKIHSGLICQINSEYMMHIETTYNPDVEETDIIEGNVMKIICQHVNDHLFSIVSWAKYMPGFTVLSLNDQTLLIKMSWGELVVANFTHRSLKLNGDVILLRNGSKLLRETAQSSGIGKLIDRIIHEILHRFRDLKIDKCELSYIKAIILFNPNLKDLENRSFVQMIRDKLYTSLQAYCREKYPSEKYRFSKLLLRLPSLRSIAHNCLDHFRLYDIIDKCKTESAIDNLDKTGKSEDNGFSFLDEMLGHSDIIMDH